MLDPLEAEPKGRDRAERAGFWISGLAHTGLVLWALVGGALFAARDNPPPQLTEVATISGAEFEELAARSRGAGPVGQADGEAPEQPLTPGDTTAPEGPDLALDVPEPDSTATTLPEAATASEDAPDLSDFEGQTPPVDVATIAPEPAQPAPVEDTAPDAPGQDVSPETSMPLRPDNQPDAPQEPETPPVSELALATSRRPPERPEGLREAVLAARRAAEEAEAAAAAQAEADRIAARQQQAEEERLAAEAAAAEQERLAQEAAAREAAAQAAEEQRLAEEREAEEARQRAEAERLAAEQAEAERLAEEQRRAEQERLEAERQAEEQRLAAERAEAERLAEEARRREEERLAEEARLEAERRAEEERRREEEARAERERLAREAQERAEEEARAAAEAELARQSALAEQLAEEQRLQEEAAAAAEATPSPVDGNAPEGVGEGGGSDILTDALNQAGAAAIQPDVLDDALADAMGETRPSEIVRDDTLDIATVPMTDVEKDGFRDAVQGCWNLATLSTDAAEMRVVVGFAMDRDGMPDPNSFRIVGDPEPEPSRQRAYEAARRAVLRCAMEQGGYDLPADKYNEWDDVEMTFTPTGVEGFE